MTDSSTSRISASRLRHLRGELSDRDRDILQFLARHRYATTVHLRRVYFTDHATLTAATRATVRVLDRLLTNRLIGRLERRIGGQHHGSAAYIWHLDVAGERLTRTPGATRRRLGDPSTTFLDHTLEVTDTHVHLLEATRTGPYALTNVQVEAEASRTFAASTGGTRVLRPDLFITLSTSDYDDHWYLEVDRGTESMPTLVAKCHAYEEYRRTGRAQAEHGVFPRVLWIVPTEKRAESLRKVIAADTTLTDRLVVTTTPDRFLTTLLPHESTDA